jgi:hypothetical protein
MFTHIYIPIFQKCWSGGEIIVGFLMNFPRFVSQSEIMPVFKWARLRTFGKA